MNKGIKKGEQSVIASVLWTVCAVLCMAQTGCAKADRALSFAAGEPVTVEASAGAGNSAPGNKADAASESGWQTGVAEREDAKPDAVSVIYVHVCGAVKNPGVVALSEESRGQDALDAAGGFTPDAATDSVNLAEKVHDGMKLYFPTREEAQTVERAAQDEAAGLIDINTADVTLLRTLPGIGEAKARAIVADREAKGPFESAEDIMRVSGIKESAYGRIRDLITAR